MSQRCFEKQSRQLKDGLNGKKHYETKIVVLKSAIRNEIRDKRIKIQSTASLLFIFGKAKVFVVRLMQLGCQLKKLYTLNIWLKHFLPMENSLGFFILHQNAVKLFQLQKTKQWLKTRILGNSNVTSDAMVLNQKEDLLIIGGDKIYFFQKQRDWNIVQIIQEKGTIYNLTLNDDKNLICEYFSKIFIFQKNQNRWEFLQRIDTQEIIRSVFFIENEIFAVYSQESRKMDIYKLNEMKLEFTKAQQVRVYGENKCEIKFCLIRELNMLIAIICGPLSSFGIKETGHISLKDIFKWNRNKQQVVECIKIFRAENFQI